MGADTPTLAPWRSIQETSAHDATTARTASSYFTQANSKAPHSEIPHELGFRARGVPFAHTQARAISLVARSLALTNLVLRLVAGVMIHITYGYEALDDSGELAVNVERAMHMTSSAGNVGITLIDMIPPRMLLDLLIYSHFDRTIIQFASFRPGYLEWV